MFPDPGPLHRIQIPGNPRIETSAFSPDGNTLYVVVSDQAINLWDFIVCSWPEIGAGIAAVATIAFLITLRRILRTTRIPGEPHCRRCNYCLKAPASDRCPECGTSTNRPIRGRTTRIRLRPYVWSLVAVLVAYALPWAFRVPRIGFVNNWVSWWSYDLEAAASKRGILLATWKRYVDRVFEIDCASGSIRTVTTLPSSMFIFYQAAITPDGTGLLLPTADSEALGLIDTSTGNVRRILPLPSHPAAGARTTSPWRQIAGFDDGGRIVYATLLDQPGKRTKLLRWDTRTGESSLLLDLAADETDNNGTAATWAHRVYRLPGPDVRFLELDSNMAHPGLEGRQTAKIHRCGQGNTTPVQFDAPASPHTSPGLRSDGSCVIFTNIGSRSAGLETHSLPSGDSSECLTPPESARIGYQSCPHAQYGRMVLSAHDRANPLAFLFVVADLDAGAWGARFSQPPEGIYQEILAPARGRFFAARGFLKNSGNAPGGFQQEFLIYDMGSSTK